MNKFSDYLNNSVVALNEASSNENDVSMFTLDNITPTRERILQDICSLLRKRTGKDFLITPTIAIINDRNYVAIETEEGEAVCVPLKLEGSGFTVVYYYKNFEENNEVADFVVSSEKIGIVKMIAMLCGKINGEEIDESLDVNVASNNLSVKFAQELVTKSINELSVLVKNVFDTDIDTFLNENKKVAGVVEFKIGESKRQVLNISFLQTLAKNVDNVYRGHSVDEKVMLEGRKAMLWGEIVAAFVVACVYRQAEDNVSIKSNVKTSVLTDGPRTLKSYYEKMGIDESQLSADRKDFEKNEQLYEGMLNGMLEYLNASTNEKQKLIDRGFRRLGIVLGRAGVGKSEAIKKVSKKIKPNDPVQIRKFSKMGNSTTALYRLLYENNGNLIVLDDAENPFRGQNIGLLKTAFNTDTTYGEVKKTTSDKSNTATAYNVEKSNTEFYDTTENGRKISRVARYLRARGSYFPKEAQMYKNFEKRSVNGDEAVLDAFDGNGRLAQQVLDAYRTARDSAMGAKHRTPGDFEYSGCMVYITNNSLDTLIDEAGGAEHWKAISSRSIMVEFYPTTSVLWEKMKKNIRKETERRIAGEDLPFAPAFEPSVILSNGDQLLAMGIMFMAVEELLTSSPNVERVDLSFRTLAGAMGGAYPQKSWQELLNDQLAKNIKVDWDAFNKSIGYDVEAKTIKDPKVVYDYLDSYPK